MISSFLTAPSITALAIAVAMMIVLLRLFAGPSVYDRVLAVNSFGTKTVLLLAALNFIMGRPDFLDIALLYTLINFVSTIAVLKFLRYRNFRLALSSLRDDAVSLETKELD
jgi:multicomponent Na+:H+ antiporter subunit F